MLLSRDSHVVSVERSTLTVSLPNAGARDSFTRCGGEELLKQSLIDVLGVDWTVEAVVEPAGGSAGRPASPPSAPAAQEAPATPASTARADTAPAPPPAAPMTDEAPPAPPAPADPMAATPDPPQPSPPVSSSWELGADQPARADAPVDPTAWPEPVRLGGATPSQTPVDPPAQESPPDSTPPRRSSQARAAIRPTRGTGSAAAMESAPTPDAEARPDDVDLDEDGLQGADLLVSRLGAQVIEEIPHDP
jgi:DNA polymerase-3 subunit gamma/tau